jgi:UTP--glucose-1-phosphate uridylyltransferase
VPREDTRRYGVVDAAAEEPGSCSARIRSLVEKPAPEIAPSTMAIVGRYILSPAIFDCIANLDPGIGGEIQLTDAISRLLKLEPVMTYRYQGKHYDSGSKAGFLAATVAYGLRHPEVGEEFREILLRAVHELATEAAYPSGSATDQDAHSATLVPSALQSA